VRAILNFRFSNFPDTICQNLPTDKQAAWGHNFPTKMQKLILIVEDHTALRASLRDWLGFSLPGCDFIEAATGEEAVTRACAQPPHLVLMDIRLPQMNGLEATRRLKAVLPQVPVVMLTIYEAPEYGAAAAAAGASAFVLKRRMDVDLLSVLKKLLGDGPPNHETQTQEKA
jgi:DNA-binding NarL/FixJ family response regulator